MFSCRAGSVTNLVIYWLSLVLPFVIVLLISIYNSRKLEPLLFGVVIADTSDPLVTTFVKMVASRLISFYGDRKKEWLCRDEWHMDYLRGAMQNDQQDLLKDPRLLDGLRWATKYFDDRLNILDAKFNGLLQVNGFSIAVLAILTRAFADEKIDDYLSSPCVTNQIVHGVANSFQLLIVVMVLAAVFSTGRRLVAVLDQYELANGIVSYKKYFEIHSSLTFERKERVRVARFFTLTAALLALALTLGLGLVNAQVSLVQPQWHCQT